MIAFFLDHWFHYYFWGGPAPTPVNVWYERGVWGNVFAELPLALLALGLFLWHHFAVKDLHRKLDALAAQHEELHELHRQHTMRLKAVLDALDPETDGGIADVLDRLDLHTDGGIADLLPLLPQP